MNESQELEQVTLEQRIMQGLDALDVSYGGEAISKLVDYMRLLSEWNKTHNLTAVDDIEEMLSIHIFDSASIKPYVKGATLLDVGSGAGLPGMVLAILSPALQVTSVESRNKKAQFQMFAANKLKLKNFTVENIRIEDYQPKEKFASVTSRAFASIEDFVEGSKQTLAPNGRWLAMKGHVPKEELKVLKKLNLKFDTFALKVPELDAQRNLVVICAPK
ncbi:MAG: 16S rRNA (guanine527-N7)-methyltransferase [Cryomorphaceae bacterium]|jgi:16S rRNA (guanine527-N7)-methyltransferase